MVIINMFYVFTFYYKLLCYDIRKNLYVIHGGQVWILPKRKKLSIRCLQNFLFCVQLPQSDIHFWRVPENMRLGPWVIFFYPSGGGRRTPEITDKTKGTIAFYFTIIYLHFPVSSPVITQRIDFVLHNP